MVTNSNGYLWLPLVSLSETWNPVRFTNVAKTAPRLLAFAAAARCAPAGDQGLHRDPRWSVEVYIIITHRIHGAGIYANIGGILMVNVTIYIAYSTWVRWVMMISLYNHLF